MGRQRKVGLDYFPFDIDFFDDEKIIAISGEFGIKGEITVIKLLCAIYRNGYFILWNDLLKYKLAKSCPGVSAELIESIVNRLVLWEFFDKALFDSVKVLTSRGIQRRYFEATKRRLKEGEEPLPYLLKNIYVDINRINVDINRISVNRKYTKESKVNKNKLSPCVDNLQKGDDATRKNGEAEPCIEAMPLQADPLPAAQKEKNCAKKEKAGAAEAVPARVEERLGTEELIAAIQGRVATADQLAMTYRLDAAGWQSVVAEIFAQWRFEGYSNTLQDALRHFANLVRKKAGDLRKQGGRQGGKAAVDAMVAGMLATARSPEQQQAEDEQFKHDFGL